MGYSYALDRGTPIKFVFILLLFYYQGDPDTLTIVKLKLVFDFSIVSIDKSSALSSSTSTSTYPHHPLASSCNNPLSIVVRRMRPMASRTCAIPKSINRMCDHAYRRYRPTVPTLSVHRRPRRRDRHRRPYLPARSVPSTSMRVRYLRRCIRRRWSDNDHRRRDVMHCSARCVISQPQSAVSSPSHTSASSRSRCMKARMRPKYV